MFPGEGRGVCVVMEYLGHRQLAGRRPAGGAVIRMRIADHTSGTHAVEGLQVTDGRSEYAH